MAYITPDGYGVNLKVFSRDQSTGTWDLGKDVPLEIPHHRDEYPYVHLSWSHLGNDIAIMDAAGHVIIFSCAMALDRMTYMRADTIQPEAEMDSVVGMHWLAILPYEQRVSARSFTWNECTDINRHKYLGPLRARQISGSFKSSRTPSRTPITRLRERLRSCT